MGVRQIQQAPGPLDVTLRAPASKSVTHRALVAAALARGESAIHDPLDADDTRITLDGLRALGFDVTAGPGRWSVVGRGGAVPGGGRLELGESGTSMRFLLAVAAAGAEPSRLDGAARLSERPNAELIRALATLGADVRSEGAHGGLPVTAGGAALRGGRVALEARQSSQFASALLLLGGALAGGIDLRLGPGAVSTPYVELTAQVLRAFGARIRRPEPRRWVVEQGATRGTAYSVEGDHSSASYFLAAAAIAGGVVRVERLRADSAQPDARLATILTAVGCRVERGPDWVRVRGGDGIAPFDLDAGDCPDLVPTLAALALFARGPCRIHNVAHLRLKESDRLDVLARNLVVLGRGAEAAADSLTIGPPAGRLHGGVITTAGDHRIAMAFAVAGLALPGIAIDDASCVTKSNPAFWTDFARLER